MSINLSKVQSIHILPPASGYHSATAVVTYKSGQQRRHSISSDDQGSTLLSQAREAGIEVTGYSPNPATVSSVALVEMLGLTPEQAKHLEGVDRLNFWRNGSLNVQAQHGCRGIKLACPKANVTDADLVLFFLAWGWEQLGQKLYFKPNAASLVRI